MHFWRNKDFNASFSKLLTVWDNLDVFSSEFTKG